MSVGNAGGRGTAEGGGAWEKEFVQESFLFGLVLLIVGGLLALVCSGFIHGMAGNIIAAGVVFLLAAGLKWLHTWMRNSPDPTLRWILRKVGLLGGARS
jgi:hypothetical protein